MEANSNRISFVNPTQTPQYGLNEEFKGDPQSTIKSPETRLPAKYERFAPQMTTYYTFPPANPAFFSQPMYPQSSWIPETQNPLVYFQGAPVVQDYSTFSSAPYPSQPPNNWNVQNFTSYQYANQNHPAQLPHQKYYNSEQYALQSQPCNQYQMNKLCCVSPPYQYQPRTPNAQSSPNLKDLNYLDHLTPFLFPPDITSQYRKHNCRGNNRNSKTSNFRRNDRKNQHGHNQNRSNQVSRQHLPNNNASSSSSSSGVVSELPLSPNKTELKIVISHGNETVCVLKTKDIDGCNAQQLSNVVEIPMVLAPSLSIQSTDSFNSAYEDAEESLIQPQTKKNEGDAYGKYNSTLTNCQTRNQSEKMKSSQCLIADVAENESPNETGPAEFNIFCTVPEQSSKRSEPDVIVSAAKSVTEVENTILAEHDTATAENFSNNDEPILLSVTNLHDETNNKSIDVSLNHPLPPSTETGVVSGKVSQLEAPISTIVQETIRILAERNLLRDINDFHQEIHLNVMQENIGQSLDHAAIENEEHPETESSFESSSGPSIIIVSCADSSQSPHKASTLKNPGYGCCSGIGKKSKYNKKVDKKEVLHLTNFQLN
ncbi:MIF4G domain-containing protein [Caenorhabditis elegans]|uniref:MIF4G domain-containing protein n=1 Tax=Caenorhabditis elegans TaxID=6239 RepID=A0A3B1DR57_CAEEL|nr:MIF4G domain-containing protein [Caenorhabditis elegans]VAY52609.1 MIF4G domain-containing protein [Caenorhabditis elegans]|eukprot:NP_001355473.1 Uncharacterized protein CELE_E02H4.2 [Caenorhabditis elegans]